MKKKRRKKKQPDKLFAGVRLPDLSDEFLKLVNEELVISVRIPLKKRRVKPK